MRDLVLMAGMLVYLPLALRFPAAGLLAWAWFSMMSPHRQVYGFASGAPLGSLITAATLVGFLVAPGPKRLPRDPVPYVMLLLVIWITINTYLALFPSYAWEFWDRNMRIFAMIFMAFLLLTTKARIIGMIWAIVIALGFYGVKGGLFTIMQAGHAIVYGPPDTIYSDNNHLALATVTELPLVFYLMRYAKAAWMRLPMLGAVGLLVLEVFGSYSRGGMIALLTMLSMLWVRSGNKILYAVVAVGVVGVGVSMMPPQFFDRMHTVNNLNADDSFQGRVDAWQVATLAANQHFPFGLGFNTAQLESVFHSYLPDHGAHAAHSIYFQMLGDHGWGGLAIYVAMLILAVINASYVRRQCRDRPELRWAYDLADMLRIALISFYVGGFALSMDYADEYLTIIAMLSCLRAITSPKALVEAARHTRGEPTRAGSDAPPRPSAGALPGYAVGMVDGRMTPNSPA